MEQISMIHYESCYLLAADHRVPSLRTRIDYLSIAKEGTSVHKGVASVTIPISAQLPMVPRSQCKKLVPIPSRGIDP